VSVGGKKYRWRKNDLWKKNDQTQAALDIEYDNPKAGWRPVKNLGTRDEVFEKATGYRPGQKKASDEERLELRRSIRASLIRFAHENPGWGMRPTLLTVLAKEKYPWEDCIADQKARYKSQEIAEKVCGKIRAESQGQ